MTPPKRPCRRSSRIRPPIIARPAATLRSPCARRDDPRFRRLLIPLLYDPAPEVADEAMVSVRAAGSDDFVFVPTLIGLLRHRRLKGQARSVLVSYGEPVIDALAHFMREPEEDIWVRRHIPATLAQITSQKSVDVLAAGTRGTGRIPQIQSGRSPRASAPRRARVDVPTRDGREAGAHAKGASTSTTSRCATTCSGERTRSRPVRFWVGRSIKSSSGSRIASSASSRLIYPWKDIVAARWTLRAWRYTERGPAHSNTSTTF